MKVIFYGKLAETIGREIDFDLGQPIATVGELRAALAKAWPEHADDLMGPRVKTLIGDDFVDDDADLDESIAIEFFPPVSGG